MSVDEDWEGMARRYDMKNGFSEEKKRKCFKEESMVYHVRWIVILMKTKSWPLYLVTRRSLWLCFGGVVEIKPWRGRDQIWLEWVQERMGGKKVDIISAHLPDYFLKTNFYNKFLWGPFHSPGIFLIHISLNNIGLKILSIHWPSVFLLWITFLFIPCSYQFVLFQAKFKIQSLEFLRHYISSVG